MVGSVANRTVVPVNDPTTTIHTLNVNNGTRYLVRVAGLNVRGRGAWSQHMILPQLQSPGERAPRAPGWPLVQNWLEPSQQPHHQL